jgi:hypothetical protein
MGMRDFLGIAYPPFCVLQRQTGGIVAESALRQD